METKIAALQMVSSPDLDSNLRIAQQLIAQAADAGARLLQLPEVFAVLEGGPMRDFSEIEGDFTAPIQGMLSSAAKKHGVTIIGGTIPLRSRPGKTAQESDFIIDDQRIRAASLVFSPSGNIIARYDKIHLFDVEVQDQQSSYLESKSYEAGDEVVVVDTDAGKLGLSVCYDLRFPELYRQLFLSGAEIVSVPAAFTKVTGEAHWETLLRARAIENQCYIFAAGQGGRHSPRRETWGHSMIIDPWGVVVDIIEQGEGIAIAPINIDKLKDIRKKMPISTQMKLQSGLS